MTDASKPRKKPEELRSQQWFGRQDRDGFAYRSWVKGKGVPHDQFDGRPVIGICNTFSELTPCNSHFRTLAEQVKIGVYEAGGFPLEFPVMSLGETLLRPTAMLYRNLASMDVEESIRGNPVDGVVLLMGCDKTTPSLVMGAASVDHCTYLTDADVDALAGGDTVATLLPGVEFSTRSPYPDAHRLLAADVTVALATDCNPGTSFTSSMPFAIALAVREMAMTPGQALWAATAGAAQALRRHDIGRIAVGARPDLTVLAAPSHVHLAYRPGVPLARPIELVQRS